MTHVRLGDLGECLATLVTQLEHGRLSYEMNEIRDARSKLARRMRGGQTSNSMYSFDESAMNSFSETASYYRQRHWDDWYEEIYHSNKCCRSPSALELILEKFMTPQMTHKSDSLVSLVRKYCESSCSEPWDNVYAFLSRSRCRHRSRLIMP